MSQLRIGERVQVPSGKIGIFKGFYRTSTSAIVWFDDEGVDTGYYTINSLKKVT